MTDSPQEERPSVVLVEDEEDLASAIEEYLRRNGFDVTHCRSGESGAASILSSRPDAVVLDLMLPGIDGFEVCRRVRAEYGGAILMLTARDEDIDEVAGLETGADDYVRKPVRPRVLLARLQALLRRRDTASNSGVPNELSVGQLVLTPSSHTAKLGGTALDLTTAEFEVLHYLVRYAGTVVDRGRLYKEVRGFPWDGVDRSVDLRVSRLRRKLGEQGSEIIRTVRGTGYLLAVES